MARGLYKLDISAVQYPPLVNGPDGEQQEAPFGDVVEISRGTKWAYIYAARNPHPELEALGATLIGSRWSEVRRALSSVDRGKVFDAEWEAEEDELDADGQPTGAKRKVMRRGKVKDKPGGVSGKPPKLNELLVPACFGSREGALEQRELDDEQGAS